MNNRDLHETLDALGHPEGLNYSSNNTGSMSTRTNSTAQTIVAFVYPSNASLNKVELEMLDKIINAMKLTKSQVRMVEDTHIQTINPKWKVYLSTSSNIGLNHSEIAIPHPKDMLQNPALKRTAWAKLQELAKKEGLLP